MPSELEMALRLVMAVALGSLIGFQRGHAGKPAGVRTHGLICLGAALFGVASMFEVAGADPTRIAAGIVTGIGFLGAGAIIRREGGMVGGLTTAATIWAVAGVGLAAGFGMYVIAAVAAALVLVILLIPHRWE